MSFGSHEGESPFLLDALAAAPSEAARDHLTASLARVARRLPQASRRHVERALVRHLVDRGASNDEEMASAIGALRRRTGDMTGEDPVHVVDQELRGCRDGSCRCRDQLDAMGEAAALDTDQEAEAAELYAAGAWHGSEADEALELDACEAASEPGEQDDELEAGEHHEAFEAGERDEAFEAGEHHEVFEAGERDEAFEAGEQDEAFEAGADDEELEEEDGAAFELRARGGEHELAHEALDDAGPGDEARESASEGEQAFALEYDADREDHEDLEDQEAASPFLDEAGEGETARCSGCRHGKPFLDEVDAFDGETFALESGPPEYAGELESPFQDEADDPESLVGAARDAPSDEPADMEWAEAPAGEAPDMELLAVLNELDGPLQDAEIEAEAGELDGAEVEMEAEAPAAAEIKRSLDAIRVVRQAVRTRQQAPNPFDLNLIASINSTSKRSVFKALQRTWLNLESTERRLAVAKAAARKKLEAKRAALVRQRDKQAAALEAWVRKHALDHNRRRRQLRADIPKLLRKVAKLRGKAREAAQAELTGKRLGLSVLEAALQASAKTYRALRDVRQTYYELSVPGRSGAVTVRLHDHVIAFATDTRGGFEGRAGSESATAVAEALRRSGVSADKQAMLRILSSLEGTFSTVNTWDRAVVTFGFIQWTTDEAGDGTLCKLMVAIRNASPETYRRCFQRFGLDVSGRLFKVTRPDGRVLTGTDAARFVQTSVKHVAALSAAGADPDVRAAQVRFAAESKIDAMLARTVSAKGKSARLSDLLTSEYAVAVLLDRATGTGENGARGAAQRGFARFVAANPKVDLATSAGRAAAGAAVLAAIEALDADRAAKYGALARERGTYSG